MVGILTRLLRIAAKTAERMDGPEGPRHKKILDQQVQLALCCSAAVKIKPLSQEPVVQDSVAALESLDTCLDRVHQLIRVLPRRLPTDERPVSGLLMQGIEIRNNIVTAIEQHTEHAIGYPSNDRLADFVHPSTGQTTLRDSDEPEAPSRTPDGAVTGF